MNISGFLCLSHHHWHGKLDICGFLIVTSFSHKTTLRKYTFISFKLKTEFMGNENFNNLYIILVNETNCYIRIWTDCSYLSIFHVFTAEIGSKNRETWLCETYFNHVYCQSSVTWMFQLPWIHYGGCLWYCGNFLYCWLILVEIALEATIL